MKFSERFKTRLRELLTREPPSFTCDVCGREVFAGERVCAPCMGALPWITTRCPICGRRVGESGVCLDCKQLPLATLSARSCFVHEGDAARLVLRLKRGQRYLAKTMAELALPLFLKEFSDTDALVFVPMTEKAEKKRGFNQSRLLAEALSELTEKPVLDPTVKTKETASQKSLGRQKRAENLKGCFHVKDRKAVRGKALLIVDDTLTTGATSSELASVLQRAGAKSVCLLTVTSVPRKDPFGKLPKKQKPSRRP